ncbi:hypothetical protein [Nocardia grenadensis]
MPGSVGQHVMRDDQRGEGVGLVLFRVYPAPGQQVSLARAFG